jgi:hypothetical protein
MITYKVTLSEYMTPGFILETGDIMLFLEKDGRIFPAQGMIGANINDLALFLHESGSEARLVAVKRGKKYYYFGN